MAKKTKKTQRTSRPTVRIRWAIVVIVAVVLLYFISARISHIWPFAVAPPSSSTTAQTTSKLPSAQSNFSDGGEKSDNRTPGASANNSATDTGGSSTPGTNSSLWSKSQDGSSILVMSPAKDSLFSSGDTVYGTATSSTVSYELEDNVSGVILQGQANVVNGKFSVKLSFSTTGTSGRINVFNQASDGTESNNVSIDVRFK